MKKILLILLLSLFLIPNVDAEGETYYCSESVNKIVSGNFITGYKNPFGTRMPVSFWSITYDGIIEVKENTSYSFKFITNPTSSDPKRVTFMFYNENKEYINYSDARVTLTSYFRNITTPAGTKYIILGLYNITTENANNVTAVLYEGDRYNTHGSIKEPIINYEQCQEIIPTPTPQDNVYSNFLTLYTDRLEYLAEGFTNNPYLMAMIGIIFSFVVLELFLQILHLRGGKYK